MKRNLGHRLVLTAFGSLLTASGAVQADMDVMDGKATMEAEVNIGLQAKDVDGSRQKFEEYRDVQNGFLLNDLRVKVDGKETPYYLDLKIRNPVQDNEFYRVDGGVHGKYKFNLYYDSIPHNFGQGTLVFSGAGTNRLSVPDSIQQSLQAVEQTRAERGGNPLVDTTGEDAQQRAIVNGLLAATGTTEFKLKREKNGAGFEANLTDSAKAWAKVTSEKKSGTRVLGIGTYERNAQTVGAAHVSDLFLVSGNELAEPIDFRTTTLTFGAGLYKNAWMLDAEYTLTKFNNRNDSLRWDNPFRFTDASSSNSAGGTASTDGGFGRGRFATGQLSLAPDSSSHDFTISGSVYDLPLHSRLTGSISYGVVTQDSAFLPYTLNTALTGVGAAGATGPAGITTTAILPASNLDGDAKTLSQSYVLTSKPIKSLTVTAKYRYYDYDNRSSTINFPGYAAYGESFWRTVKNDRNAPVSNEPLSFKRQTAELGADYHVSKSLTLMLEGGWEGWDRRNLRIDSTDETSIRAGFIAKPMANAKLSGHYRHAKRSVDGYKAGNTAANPEAPGQINYDWADRDRDQFDLRFMMSPSQALSFGVSVKSREDDLGGNNRFGLKTSDQKMVAFDVTYDPSEELSFYANYAKDWGKSFLRSAAKDNAVAGESYLTKNYWNSEIKDTTDTFGLGLKAQLASRLTLDASYNLSSGKMAFTNTNPNAVTGTGTTADTLANGIAQAWPDVKNRTETFKAMLSYSATKTTDVGVSYLYEKYKLDDFTNAFGAYPTSLAENSTRYIFTGANQFSYKAHMVGVFLKTRF